MQARAGAGVARRVVRAAAVVVTKVVAAVGEAAAVGVGQPRRGRRGRGRGGANATGRGGGVGRGGGGGAPSWRTSRGPCWGSPRVIALPSWMKTVDIRTPSTKIPPSPRSTAIHWLPLWCSTTGRRDRALEADVGRVVGPTTTSRPGAKAYLRGPSQTIRGEPNDPSVGMPPPFAPIILESNDHCPLAMVRRAPRSGVGAGISPPGAASEARFGAGQAPNRQADCAARSPRPPASDGLSRSAWRVAARSRAPGRRGPG